MIQENQKRNNSQHQQSPQQNSPSRSRQKPSAIQIPPQRQQTYLRKINLQQKNSQSYRQPHQSSSLHPSNSSYPSYNQTESKQQTQKKQIKKQLLRSFLRIQQLRQEPIDKFVKIVWIYKGKFVFDRRVLEIMADPKRYLERLSVSELSKMVQLAQGHRLYEHYEKSHEQQYWLNLINLIKYIIDEKTKGGQKQLQPQYQQRIKQILQKPLPQLIKLQKQTIMVLKTQAFGSSQNLQYWKQVLNKIKIKRVQLILHKFYLKYRQDNYEQINQINEQIQENIYKEPTSPTLVPFSSVNINPKMIVQEQEQRQQKKKLAKKIYEIEFQKGKDKLLINLSLPQNHSLLTTQIITQQTSTYDQITKQIIEFEKYKRMEQDQQQFNDWVPCQTQGRFRQQKPIYINRVRVAYQWNKYNSMHYTEDNPPPKTIQGYKFNVFYPDLFDKQKTPQYYLQNTDDPNYCVIKFKAGPPYKDIAFKILKKQWDITQKSGFQSIFAKGILHLYFNFKKPRFRI